MARRPLLAGVLVAVLVGLSGCGGGGGDRPTTPTATTARTTAAGTPAKQRKRAAAAEIEAQALGYYAQQGKPIFCGGRKRYAALTFDDGPGDYTPLARKWLKRYGVDATFFLVGRNVAPHAEQARDELRAGYALGNHSWSHPYLPGLSDDEIARQLGDTQKAIKRATGEQVQLFRPPYGAHDPRIDAEARRLGMVQIIWNVDSRDSEGADHDEIARRVLAGIGPGAIVLLHENRGQTIRALWERILPELRKRKLKLVTVPQLLAVNPPSKRQLALPGGGCRGITGTGG